VTWNRSSGALLDGTSPRKPLKPGALSPARCTLLTDAVWPLDAYQVAP
jgi:hypothetical protein